MNPGTTWLLTPRCRPAWIAALNILDDDQWHPIEDVVQAMRDASTMASRTIENHFASAGRRRWIERRRGRIRLRDRAAFEAALDAAETQR